MIAYIIRRLFYAIPILIGVNLLTFLLFFVVNTPDDMARMQLGMKRVTPDAAALDRYGAEMYEASCALCHKAVRPEAFTVNQWIGKMNAMKRFVPLDENEYALLLSYVQRLAAKSPGG